MEQSATAESDEITLIASTTLPQANSSPAKLKVRIPKLPAYFTGTGDLLAALLLAWLHRYPDNVALAIETAVAGLQGVLQATAAACGPSAMSTGRSASVFAARELMLVQNQQHIVEPRIEIRAESL